jgi:hypothetical protein
VALLSVIRRWHLREGVSIREIARRPGGHLNFPHPWPGQIPPAEAAGRRDGYTLSARFATRAAASFSRQLLPSNLSRCA